MLSITISKKIKLIHYAKCVKKVRRWEDYKLIFEKLNRLLNSHEIFCE